MIAATMIASGDSPVRDPYSHGSMMFEVIISTAPNSAAVHSTIDQSGDTANATDSGKVAASADPI